MDVLKLTAMLLADDFFWQKEAMSVGSPVKIELTANGLHNLAVNHNICNNHRIIIRILL